MNKTHEEKMKTLKEGLTGQEILSNEDLRICNFSVDTIREYTLFELKEQNKEWNDMQVDILVQGVENSDWLKINFETEELSEEICSWIKMLEEEWQENNEFGY